MRQRSGGGGVLLLFLGILLAGAAAVGVFLTVNSTPAAPAITPETTKMVEVVVASTLIPDRTRIAQNNIKTIRINAEDVQPDMILRKEDVIGKLAAYRILPGEMVLRSKLGDVQTSFAYNKELTKGKVLMTFPTSDLFTIGAINPGDHVDMMITLGFNLAYTETLVSPFTGQPIITYAPPTPTPVVTTTVTPVKTPSAATPVPTTQGIAPTNVISKSGEFLVTQMGFQNLLVVSVGGFTGQAPPSVQASQENQTQASATNNADPNNQKQTKADTVPTDAQFITVALTPQEALLLKSFKDYEGTKKFEFVLRAAGDDTIYTTNPTTIMDIMSLYRIVPPPRGITVNELTNQHVPVEWPNQYPMPQPPPATPAPTPTVSPTPTPEPATPTTATQR